MKRILITAFEPFGGETVNTSAEVLRMLPGMISGFEIQKLLLPVIFEKAGQLVLEQKADYIFLLGEAGGRSSVTPELKAVNLRNARIPDNEGNRPVSLQIRSDGPDEYKTPVSVRSIVEEMREAGYAIEVSYDAGTYVCNDTFYIVGTGSRVPVEFIHVPHKIEDLRKTAETVWRFIERAINSMTMKSIEVVAAIILDQDRIFATQRGYGPYRGGWEFPGGKVEPGETPEEAIKREIREELETEIRVEGKAGHVEYDYPEFHLSMDCFYCSVVAGSLTLKEHEAAKWLTREDLWSVDWLPADCLVAQQLIW